MRKITRTFTGVTFSFIFLLCLIIGFYYTNLPDKYYLSENGSFNINTFFNITADYSGTVKPAYAADSAGDSAQLNLLGIFPIKDVKMEKIDRPSLVPCGTPFGIKIITCGAIVTEVGEVEGETGFISPAKSGGIRSGDIITKVNGCDILRNNDIAKAVQKNTSKTTVNFTRDGKEHVAEIAPIKSKKDGAYKIGLWVRDSSAGIGTMTYYDPKAHSFGGLGHAVCDIDTGQIMPLSKGEAVSVFISGVVKGSSGSPGELCGTFLSRVPIGLIKGNTESGVFGIMENPPVIGQALPMAYKQEVEIGPATIFATLNGNTPKEYNVIIEKIDYNDSNKIKNMIIRVTDRELLNNAGGIVQGMSGSPILQNDRICGAVTHVFVNDSTRGYAIFAENMYRASLGVDLTADEMKAAA